ncbi:MAG: VWA domain-containing protein [Chloroflexia bacterium]
MRRGNQGPDWTDGEMHRLMYEGDPELYALSALSESALTGQRMRVLFQLLHGTRVGLTEDARRTLSRVSALLLALLPADDALTVFLALRRSRANHKHTSRAIVDYVVNHPKLADMARRRRRGVVDSLEHALGKDVARGVVRTIFSPASDSTYARSHLLRFAREPERLIEVLAYLYRQRGEESLSPVTTEAGYAQTHAQYVQAWSRLYERPDVVTATNRGNIAATLVHIYQGGTTMELEQALVRFVDEAAQLLPRFEGKVAVVLDVSASTRGYGNREFCIVAQSVALQRVLARNCAELRVHKVGGAGSDRLPWPAGLTDLAESLVGALEEAPDVVAIVSDGYENVYSGDLARVVATLPQLGLRIPVIFCHSKFSHSDDLSFRRPAPDLPETEFWHQSDFEDVMLRLFTAAQDGAREKSVREFLRAKLDRVEREVAPWTTSN